VDRAVRAVTPSAYPSAGAGRLASWAVRIGALVLDWFACLLAAFAFASRDSVTSGGARFLPVLLLVVETALLTATLGGSAGQLLLGVRVRRVDGSPAVGLGRALVRSVLLALLVPPVVYDGDRRGLHDRAAGTVVVRSH
jgi:uncharacterized RDD family membrane protein YckC